VSTLNFRVSELRTTRGALAACAPFIEIRNFCHADRYQYCDQRPEGPKRQ
jgi:hypothetical protein